MPVLDNDLVFRRAALVSDLTPTQNGGRMSALAIVSSVKNNLFPDVTQAQRTAGADHWRKLFLHAASADGSALIDARVFLEDRTPGDDHVLLYAGTHSDTQEAVLGRPYGVGRLAAAAAVGDTVLEVEFEHAQMAVLRPVRAGDVVRVYDIKPTVNVQVLATVSAVAWSGARASITLADALEQAFEASGSLDYVTVASVIATASLQASATAPVVSSAGGAFAGAPVGSSRGTILQSWTLTFTSSTAYRLDGDTLGSNVATGNVAVYFSPDNPAGGVYFTLHSTAFSGTWSAGDTLTFDTTPAALPLWLRRIVPPGARSLGGNGVVVSVQGESA